MQPNDGYILDTVGWVYFRKGEIEEAIRYLEAAHSQKPNEAVVAEHLGDAYYVYELVGKAKEMYQRAVRLETDQGKNQQNSRKACYTRAKGSKLMTSVNLLAYLSLAVLISSCGTAPKQMADVSPEGQVRTKILVEDLKTKKSHLLNMDVKALKDGPLRMDVTSGVGIHLFSLITKEDGVEYILVRQKKHYKGENSEMALKPILNMPLDPNHLRNLIFQLPIADKDWSCTDDEGTLRDCINMRRRIKVMWKKDKSDRPLIDIRYSRRVRVQINVRDVSEYEGDPDKTFSLKVPKSFKKIRIN